MPQLDPGQRIERLACELLFHKKLYYQGQSTLTDAEYDALEEELRGLSPNHPALSFVGYPLAEDTAKVFHELPMLSLAKTYSTKDLLDFASKFSSVAAIDKFDGMALALEYNREGRFFRASTRGDGTFGEDVTESVFYAQNLPKMLACDPRWDIERFEVRGELYFPLSEFSNFSERFDSFRNAIAGTLGRKELENARDVLRVLRFAPYDLLAFDAQNKVLDAHSFFARIQTEACYTNKISFLQSLGFSACTGYLHEPLQVGSEDELKSLLGDLYGRDRDYKIDGIVFRVQDEILWETLGSTAHHPRGSLAFKQAGETAQTEILAIEQKMGRSGKVTFRAKLKPVFLSGAQISHATLHNADFIEKGGYSVGAQVEIIRSGEVIPAILRCTSPGPEIYRLPDHCPCGFPLARQNSDLYCSSEKSCYLKDQESLVHFVSSLGMTGISDKIVFKLREACLVSEPADFYKISLQDLLELEGFGQKSGENFLQTIEKNRQIPLAKFLTALGLKRGSHVRCGEIARKCVNLEKVLLLRAEDLAKEKGWAEKSARDFLQSLQDKLPLVHHLLAHVQVLPDHSARQAAGAARHPYFGKSVCITGVLSRPREEYLVLLEKVGAKLSSAVSAKTSFLVCQASAATSTKYRQALKYNIPIVDEKDFLANLDTDSEFRKKVILKCQIEQRK